MFTIGDFARNGRVSVRMLRHYDALGLLRPARVDAVSGYRSYDAGQLARLNRLVALKDLGFTLDQVRSILEDALSAAELSGMLRMRRAELQSRIAADTRRLGQVEARLRTIEMEGSMPTDDIQVKQIPAVRVAELSGAAHGFEPQSIGPVIGPLYNELMHQLREAGAGGRPGHRLLRGGARRRCHRPCVGAGQPGPPGRPSLRCRRSPRDRAGRHDRPPRLDGNRHDYPADSGALDRRLRSHLHRLQPGALPRVCSRGPGRLGD